MALDPKATTEGMLQHVQNSKAHAERQLAKAGKDEENRAYYSGQIDILDELEACLTV